MKEQDDDTLTGYIFKRLDGLPTRIIYLFILLISLVFLILLGLLGKSLITGEPKKMSPHVQVSMFD
jgi:hypothetical protein